MTPDEQLRIIRSSQDFFAKDATVWKNISDRFCYIYEVNHGEAPIAIGAESSIAILLSILSYGEVHSPIQWTENNNGGGGACSSSTAVNLFFRHMNSKYITVDLATIKESLVNSIEIFEQEILNDTLRTDLDSILVERLYSAKSHAVSLDADHISEQQMISRAADLCIVLEYIMNEGSKSEVLFRLGLSVAWILGETPEERDSILNLVKNNYDLRSKKVHGVKVTEKQKRKFSLESLFQFDVLVRRVILSKLVSRLNDKEWVEKIVQARIGNVDENFNRVEWINA
jgi:hypothetical protein